MFRVTDHKSKLDHSRPLFYRYNSLTIFARFKFRCLCISSLGIYPLLLSLTTNSRLIAIFTTPDRAHILYCPFIRFPLANVLLDTQGLLLGTASHPIFKIPPLLLPYKVTSKHTCYVVIINFSLPHYISNGSNLSKLFILVFCPLCVCTYFLSSVILSFLYELLFYYPRGFIPTSFQQLF